MVDYYYVPVVAKSELKVVSKAYGDKLLGSTAHSPLSPKFFKYKVLGEQATLKESLMAILCKSGIQRGYQWKALPENNEDGRIMTWQGATGYI